MRLVSVIIPTRDRVALLKEAIESVLAVRRDGFELEVIVIDDGSTDATPEIAGTYPVMFLRTEGIGVSAARNVGIAAAHGDFLAFIDDDDIWLPENVGTQLRVFEEHPEYGAVLAQVQLTDSQRNPFGAPVPHPPLRSGWVFDDMLAYWAQLGSVVVRRSVVEDVGPLDPRLVAAEDWEWMLRIARQHSVGQVATPVVLFRQRSWGDPDYITADTEWQRLRNVVRIFRQSTRQLDLYRRLTLQRVIWKHRGWYAFTFAAKARGCLRRGERARALRCVAYALLASPPHVGLMLARSARGVIASPTRSQVVSA